METQFTAILTDDNKLVPNVQDEVLNLITFLKGIDWTEPWLIGLLVFHVLIMTLTVVTRHHGNFQGIFFFSLLLLVLCAKKLNELAANNWEYFAGQQYFDSNGMFISLVFSSPILLNCLIMVGHWLYWSGAMTIKIKQAQLREKLRAESRIRRQRREAGQREESDQAPPTEAETAPGPESEDNANHTKME